MLLLIVMINTIYHFLACHKYTHYNFETIVVIFKKLSVHLAVQLLY